MGGGRLHGDEPEADVTTAAAKIGGSSTPTGLRRGVGGPEEVETLWPRADDLLGDIRGWSSTASSEVEKPRC